MTELQKQYQFAEQSVETWQKDVDQLNRSIEHLLTALENGTAEPKNSAKILKGLLSKLQDSNLHLATAKCERRELAAVMEYDAADKWKEENDKMWAEWDVL